VRQVNVEAVPLHHQLGLHAPAKVAEVEERHVNLGVVNLVKHVVYALVGNLKLRLWRAQHKDTPRKALLQLLELERVLRGRQWLHAMCLELLVSDGRRGDDQLALVHGQRCVPRGQVLKEGCLQRLPLAPRSTACKLHARCTLAGVTVTLGYTVRNRLDLENAVLGLDRDAVSLRVGLVRPRVLCADGPTQAGSDSGKCLGLLEVDVQVVEGVVRICTLVLCVHVLFLGVCKPLLCGTDPVLCLRNVALDHLNRRHFSCLVYSKKARCLFQFFQ